MPPSKLEVGPNRNVLISGIEVVIPFLMAEEELLFLLRTS